MNFGIQMNIISYRPIIIYYLSFIEVIPGKLQSFQLPDQKQGVVYDNFSSGYTGI